MRGMRCVHLVWNVDAGSVPGVSLRVRNAKAVSVIILYQRVERGTVELSELRSATASVHQQDCDMGSSRVSLLCFEAGRGAALKPETLANQGCDGSPQASRTKYPTDMPLILPSAPRPGAFITNT
ncbi:hypothetical protein SRHO_G00063250 [Serrasalmus rhombeus]